MNMGIPTCRRRTANKDRAADATRHAVPAAPTRRTPRRVRSSFPNSQKSNRQNTKPDIVMTATACKSRGFTLSPLTAPAMSSSKPSTSHAEPDASARRRGRAEAIGTVPIITPFVEVPGLTIALHDARRAQPRRPSPSGECRSANAAAAWRFKAPSAAFQLFQIRNSSRLDFI